MTPNEHGGVAEPSESAGPPASRDRASQEARAMTAAGQQLFESVVSEHVQPEAERRIATDEWDSSEVVWRFQVLFRNDGDIVVRLNHEVGGTASVKIERPLRHGEEVYINDISELSDYTPADEDRDVPHVSAFMLSNGWTLAFHLGLGHPKRHDFLARADEFLPTAREALAAGRLAAFVDTAFSATELLARAELLACSPTVKLTLETKDHGYVQSTYKLWGDLGNTPKKYPWLLKRMAKLRKRGRYVDDVLDLDTAEARSLLDGITEMREHVARRVGGDLPDKFTVYATRDIRGGEMVGAGSYTLKPLRGRAAQSARTQEPD